MTTERTIEIFNDYDRISGKLIRGNSEDDNLFNSETVDLIFVLAGQWLHDNRITFKSGLYSFM